MQSPFVKRSEFAVCLDRHRSTGLLSHLEVYFDFSGGLL